jgi:hypothetical protein
MVIISTADAVRTNGQYESDAAPAAGVWGETAFHVDIHPHDGVFVARQHLPEAFPGSIRIYVYVRRVGRIRHGGRGP